MLCTQGYELLRVIEKKRQLSVIYFVRFILLIQDLIDPRLASTYVVEDGFELLILLQFLPSARITFICSAWLNDHDFI